MTEQAYFDPQPLWQEQLPGGHHWSARLRRGSVLSLTALGAQANVALYCVNAENPTERFNMPDSLKAQHTAYLSAGHVLYSDLGRVLLSIIQDDHGWNDVLCGPSTAAQIQHRYGQQPFSHARNAMYRNGLDSLLIEMHKYGLSQKDFTASLNLFSKVYPDEQGHLHYDCADHTGQQIALRVEMDCLVFLSNTPHGLNPASTYQPSDIQLQLFKALPYPEFDLCRDACAQNQRGFANTLRYYALSH